MIKDNQADNAQTNPWLKAYREFIRSKTGKLNHMFNIVGMTIIQILK